MGEYGVRCHRGAVHDQIEPRDETLQREIQARGELAQAGREPERRIVGRAARLVNEPDVVAGKEEVGERPPDVDADSIAHAAPLRRAVACASTDRPSAASATP